MSEGNPPTGTAGLSFRRRVPARSGLVGEFPLAVFGSVTYCRENSVCLHINVTERVLLTST